MPGEKRWNKWRSRASLWHSPGEPPEPLEPHTECQHQLLRLLISTYFLPSSIIITLNLECGWLQSLVYLESAFYSFISGVAIYILKVLDLLLLIFSGVLNFWVSIVATMSDSKTSPHRETNFLLLRRLVLFFMNKKESLGWWTLLWHREGMAPDGCSLSSSRIASLSSYLLDTE